MVATQDLRTRILSVGLHLTATAMYAFALYWQATHREPPSFRDIPANRWKIGGRFKFLTYWNNWIQAVGFSLILIADILAAALRTRSPILVRFLKLRDLFFNSVQVPIGIFVSLAFWAIYAVDRELIFPRALEPYYPVWLSHLTHTTMIVFLPVEVYINRHPLPQRLHALVTLGTLALGYLIWVLYLGVVKEVWVYPILNVLPWAARFLFIGTCTVLILLLYIAYEAVHQRLWSSGRGRSKAALRELPAERPERTNPPRRAKQAVKRD